MSVILHIFHIRQSETHLMQGSNNFPNAYRPEGWHAVLYCRHKVCCEPVTWHLLLCACEHNSFLYIYIYKNFAKVNPSFC